MQQRLKSLLRPGRQQRFLRVLEQIQQIFPLLRRKVVGNHVVLARIVRCHTVAVCRQDLVVGAQRHKQREWHEPEAQREVAEDLRERVKVLLEVTVGEVVVDEDQHQGGDELERENFHFWEGAQDEQVGQLCENSEDDEGVWKIFGEEEEDVESDGDLGGDLDDLFGFLGVFLDQFWNGGKFWDF
jgi:hypothetical protein